MLLFHECSSNSGAQLGILEARGPIYENGTLNLFKKIQPLNTVLTIYKRMK